MTRQLLRALMIVLAPAWALPAAAQTLSFGSAAPAVTAKDSTTPKKDTVPAKPEFKPSWSFNAWLFGAYTYETDSATKAKNDDNATSKFTVDRAYLTFQGRVAPKWAFRVTTDVQQGTSAGGAYAGLLIKLKYAYAQWDYTLPASPDEFSAWARIGQIHTVIIDDEERFWPRWLQKTAIEFWGLQVSSDLGASTQLTLPNGWGRVYATIGNGGGYTVAETDRYKDAALRFSFTPLSKSSGLLKTLQITPWGSWGTTQASVVTQPGLVRNRYGINLENADPRLTFGLEYAQMENGIDSIGPPYGKSNVTSPLYDGFVVVRPFLFGDPKGPPLGIVARYDHFEPNNSSATSSRNETFLLFGVFYDVAKSTSVGLTYQDVSVNSGATAPFKTDQTTYQLNWQLTF